MVIRVVHTSKSPFEIFLLAAAVVSGLFGLISPLSSGHVVMILPTWMQTAWNVGLILAGLLALVGVVTSRQWGLDAERGGLLMLGGLSLAYAAGIVAVAGIAVASLSAISVLSFAAASLVRARQITRDIRRIEGSDESR